MSISVNYKNNNVLFSGKKQKMFFMSTNFRIIVFIIAIAISFLILSISAGIVNYSSIYALDAVVENKKEIGGNDDIKIIFNQPVIFLDFDNIDINPNIDLNLNLSDNNKILILSNNKLFLNEIKYEIELKNIRGFSGLLMKNKKFVFYTKSKIKKNKISDNNKKEFFSEFKLSKNKYIPPESSRPKNEIKIEPKFIEGKYIDISIANQVMTLFEDGIKTNSFLISSGKYGMPTPIGIFSVKKKEPNHWSSTYGLWMPYSMNFYGAFYIHELPYWPNGYREGEDHLGVRVSHGCIRLGVGPAEYVFDWSEIGTQVYVHY
ncbi:MAG: L,D-transpeptidase [Candidatus Pacebacteria bacterium]|nr:L,D-transpeptidase [Candidatus Paceibacterota bacterium]